MNDEPRYCDHEEVHTVEGELLVTRCRRCPSTAVADPRLRHDWRHLDPYLLNDPTTDEELAEAMDWTGEAPDPGELLRKTFGEGPVDGLFTHTFTPTLPRTMTRRETYRHCIDNGWRRRDALLMALLSEDERPVHHERLSPTFTIERSEESA